jgi:hypothetical protein
MSNAVLNDAEATQGQTFPAGLPSQCSAQDEHGQGSPNSPYSPCTDAAGPSATNSPTQPIDAAWPGKMADRIRRYADLPRVASSLATSLKLSDPAGFSAALRQDIDAGPHIEHLAGRFGTSANAFWRLTT